MIMHTQAHASEGYKRGFGEEKMKILDIGAGRSRWKKKKTRAENSLGYRENTGAHYEG